jgi:hypothetical protein
MVLEALLYPVPNISYRANGSGIAISHYSCGMGGIITDNHAGVIGSRSNAPHPYQYANGMGGKS